MSVKLPEPAVGFPQDFDHCRRVIKAGSKSFHFASLLLPTNVRQAAYATYAFCRFADDEIDLGDDPVAALKGLSDRLDHIYAGTPYDSAIDRAFSHVVRVFALPRELPDALLEGMLWDTENRRYETFEDILDYAARVAGSVGAMMTVLMGNRSPEAVARACDLGLAMQLTNIARDVGEDARAGRLYLPLEWLDAEGIKPDVFLKRPTYNAAIRRIVKRLLDAADPFYARGLSGVSLLPEECQTSIRAAGSIYREIGVELRRLDYNSIQHRAVVSKTRKIKLLIKAARESSAPSSADAAAAATQYLVSAVTAKESTGKAPIPPTRINWLIDLFMRLERQERIV
ncbi:MAG: phytoene/squalene synthase family protein [Hyphomonadaceae bacterium]|nr:phytoene/squalene synthase family protein [Hyphomonadaceae bacterium]